LDGPELYINRESRILSFDSNSTFTLFVNSDIERIIFFSSCFTPLAQSWQKSLESFWQIRVMGRLWTVHILFY